MTPGIVVSRLVARGPAPVGRLAVESVINAGAVRALDELVRKFAEFVTVLYLGSVFNGVCIRLADVGGFIDAGPGFCSVGVPQPTRPGLHVGP